MIFEVDVTGSNSQKHILAHCVSSKRSSEATRKSTNPDHHHFGDDFHIVVNYILTHIWLQTGVTSEMKPSIPSVPKKAPTIPWYCGCGWKYILEYLFFPFQFSWTFQVGTDSFRKNPVFLHLTFLCSFQRGGKKKLNYSKNNSKESSTKQRKSTDASDNSKLCCEIFQNWS